MFTVSPSEPIWAFTDVITVARTTIEAEAAYRGESSSDTPHRQQHARTSDKTMAYDTITAGVTPKVCDVDSRHKSTVSDTPMTTAH